MTIGKDGGIFARLRNLFRFGRSGGDEPVRRSWHGVGQPPPTLPSYLRTSKRLKSLDEFEDPPWKGRVRWPADDRVTAGGLVRETGHWLVVLRPFILGGILVSIALSPVADPALVEPPAFLSSEPEQVSESFTRCGLGRGHACVIDGDTFRLGQRKVRIIGIDTPETHPPRCAEEARLGELATARLQELLNQGAFEMVAPIYGSEDRYGRDLRVIRRKLPDGSYQSIAEEMRETGVARRYLGGFRSGWC